MSDFYVSTNGSDANNGSKESPFLTIEGAIANSCVANGDNIYIDKGSYNITSIVGLTKDYKSIKLIGKPNETTFVVLSNPGLSDFLCDIEFMDIIFKPSDDFSGYKNVFVYSNDSMNVIYYNCVFKKSDSGVYPTEFLFRHGVNSTNNVNKKFYNCTFITDIQITVMNKTYFYNCATTCDSYSSNSNYYVLNECVVDVRVGNNYMLKNADNGMYGVYSGTKAPWTVGYYIKMDNDYYSIKNENYDIDLGKYIPIKFEYDNIDNSSFTLCELFQEVTINGETFKPIEKFDNFSLVHLKDFPIKLSGTKSYSELIVANGDIDINIANYINSLKLVTNQVNSNIKVAISLDSGNTWNTYSSTEDALIPLTVTIPLKDYRSSVLMTDDDKINYENAKAEILLNGITVSDFNNLPFNELLAGCKSLRLAYAIEIQADESVGELDKLEWNFDSIGRMYKMSDSEVTVDIYSHSVLVTPLIDNDIIKTNIVF